jgi:ABC-type lipoprotein release transport system permease subunit
MGRALGLILKYNLRSVAVRGTDAIMTLAGIALCAAVVVVVNALDEGIGRAFVTSGSPGVIVFLRKGAPTEVQGRIELEAANLVRTLEGIQGEVSKEVVVLCNLPRRADGKPSNVLVRGVDPAGIALRAGFKLVGGRMPDPNASEVLVARRMAERITGLGLGETFVFGKSRFAAVGLFEAGGTSDSEVWAPPSLVQTAFDRAGNFSSIRARLQGATAQEQQASLARIQVQLEGNARLPLRVELETAYYSSQEEDAAAIPRVLGKLLALFIAIGASMGAMNTMYGRTATRAREIATLRALGYKRPAIVVAFTVESMLLSLLGGALGCVLALPANGWTSATTALATMSEVTFELRIGVTGVAEALILAATVGLLGGLLPAVQAARRSIPGALRDA